MGAPVLAASSHIPAIAAHDGEINPPHIVSRRTKGNRMLWYCLKVIQQPERARACGSGPKSSADRRPVDPPPVVELRIYEGDNWERAQSKDITFIYNANFFLYATLEHARVMAHGRVQTPAANSPPVLTGMPVSGMAYLDRPQEAGYFLFPDLSVRHEGRYRLTFNLYEETKEEADKDIDSAESKPVTPDYTPATGGSFDFRMEVKSQDFVVYSAKKFPGLTESTALSRVVAEQGCRVRIRRDVRMRRRDGKGGGGGGGGGESYENPEDEYARRRRTATPDTRADAYRHRSMSGSQERVPYNNDPQRRPSIAAEYSPQYAPPPPSAGGHLGFLGGNSSSQGFAQPAAFAQAPSVPASPVYPPSQNSGYSSQNPYSTPTLPPPPPPQQQQPQQPQYQPYTERTPVQSYAPQPLAQPRRDSLHEPRGPAGSLTLPPLMIAPQQPPYAAQKLSLPPLQMEMPAHTSMSSPSPTTAMSRSSILNGPSSAGFSRPQLTQYAGTKRAHGESFRPPEQARFQDGARDQGRVEDNAHIFQYKRAGGEVRYRAAPEET
ncbi:hypothetical protein OQA88_11430 [Cercophora sp. LCS_1]